MGEGSRIILASSGKRLVDSSGRQLVRDSTAAPCCIEHGSSCSECDGTAPLKLRMTLALDVCSCVVGDSFTHWSDVSGVYILTQKTGEPCGWYSEVLLNGITKTQYNDDCEVVSVDDFDLRFNLSFSYNPVAEITYLHIEMRYSYDAFVHTAVTILDLYGYESGLAPCIPDPSYVLSPSAGIKCPSEGGDSPYSSTNTVATLTPVYG